MSGGSGRGDKVREQGPGHGDWFGGLEGLGFFSEWYGSQWRVDMILAASPWLLV